MRNISDASGKKYGIEGDWKIDGGGHVVGQDLPSFHAGDLVFVEPYGFAKVTMCTERSPGRVKLDWTTPAPAANSAVTRILTGNHRG